MRELNDDIYKCESNGMKCMKELKGPLTECDKLYVLGCNYGSIWEDNLHLM